MELSKFKHWLGSSRLLEWIIEERDALVVGIVDVAYDCSCCDDDWRCCGGPGDDEKFDHSRVMLLRSPPMFSRLIPRKRFGVRRPGDKCPIVIFESGSRLCCITGGSLMIDDGGMAVKETTRQIIKAVRRQSETTWTHNRSLGWIRFVAWTIHAVVFNVALLLLPPFGSTILEPHLHSSLRQINA